MILVVEDGQSGIDDRGEKNEADNIRRSPADEGHEVHVRHLGNIDVVRAARVEQQAGHRAAADGSRCCRTNAGADQKRNEGGAGRRGGAGSRHDGNVDAEGQHGRHGNEKTAQLLQRRRNGGNQMLVALRRRHDGGKAHGRTDGGHKGDVRHALHKRLKSLDRLAGGRAHRKARQNKHHSGFVTFDESQYRQHNHCAGEPDLPSHFNSPLVNDGVEQRFWNRNCAFSQ